MWRVPEQAGNSTDECRASGTDQSTANCYLNWIRETALSDGISRASGTGFVVDFDHEEAAVVDSPGIRPVQTSQASL